ncbi:MAG: right-handed parallel beta-helix repeat-containing protein [Spirochaetota bacterium]
MKMNAVGIIVLFIAIALTPGYSAGVDGTSYYVSPTGMDSNSGRTSAKPLKSINYAVAAAALDPGAGPLAKPVTVYLMDGVHVLEAPVRITNSDAWPIMFKALPGAKPIVTGARKIVGWKPGIVPTTGVPCLVADVGDVKKWYFRQLFVNGRRAERPRYPKEGFSRIESLIPSKPGRILSTAFKDRFMFREGDVQAWTNITDINAMVVHYWQQAYLAVTNISPADRTVYFRNASYMPLVHSHPSHGVADWIKQDTAYDFETWYQGASYYMDNVFDELREKGSWYLERTTGKLYYLPLDGETASSIEAWAPRLTQYFIVQSDWKNSAYIDGVSFEGIAFRYSEYVWNAHYGTGNWYGNYGPSVLTFSGTRRTSVLNCRFENLGECGIDLAYGNSDIAIIGNVFRDLASGAIRAMGAWREKKPEDNETGRMQRIAITDNDIAGYGRVFHGAVALLLEMASHSVIAHNRITDGYMTAINCGGGSMGHEDVFRMFDTLIAKNHIYNIGQSWPCANDLAGIYTHGNMIGSVVRGNIISNIQVSVYGGNGIYIDDCASYLTVEDNLVADTCSDAFNLKGRRSIIRNNILGPSGRSIARRASHKSYENELAHLYGNLLITTNGLLFDFNNADGLTNSGMNVHDNYLYSVGGAPHTVGIDGTYGAYGRSMAYSEWCALTGNGSGDVVLARDFSYTAGVRNAAAGSPLLKHGFKQIDLSDAGPRAAGVRVNISFLTTRSEGSEAHREAMDYAKKIVDLRREADTKNRDMSKHVE